MAIRKRSTKAKPAAKPARKRAAPARKATKKAANAGAKHPRAAAAKKVPARKATSTGRDRAKNSPARSKPRRQAAPRRASARRSPRARRAPASDVFDSALLPCGDEALRAATGKDWGEWFALLDAAGAAARSLDHAKIWDLAMQALPASAGWWGQMVSVGYERARGLRAKHETSSGDFQATFSRTLPVPLFAAFAAWADEALRGNWLDAPGLDVTKINAGRNIRARWPDGRLLDIRFEASGPDACRIVVDTMKLADAGAVQEAKVFWQGQLDRLRSFLQI
ncbi:MAG TPA: hypothetical protein VHE32_02795 [Rhodanobacteraceae bacterium]|nr:hypothetical protein [Rhodanobacteraceae bacterium]